MSSCYSLGLLNWYFPSTPTYKMEDMPLYSFKKLEVSVYNNI